MRGLANEDGPCIQTLSPGSLAMITRTLYKKSFLQATASERQSTINMWMNITLAATASLAASAVHSIAEVSLSDKPVPAPIIGKYGNHNASYSFLDKPSPEFDLQTGLDWNPKQPVSDAFWKKYVEKGKHFECLMSAPEKVAQNLIAGGTPAKSLWTVSRR
jgi:hypothetical protein